MYVCMYVWGGIIVWNLQASPHGVCSSDEVPCTHQVDPHDGELLGAMSCVTTSMGGHNKPIPWVRRTQLGPLDGAEEALQGLGGFRGKDVRVLHPTQWTTFPLVMRGFYIRTIHNGLSMNRGIIPQSSSRIWDYIHILSYFLLNVSRYLEL